MMDALTVIEKTNDESSEITQEMCDEYFSQINKIDDKVNRLVTFMDNAKLQAARYSNKAEDFKNRATFWEKTLERLEDYCVWLLNTYPQLEFRGSDYQLLKKINPPSLKVPLKKSFSSSNIIPDELIFSVPEKYRECKIVWLLKTNDVKEDLKLGKKLNFATLEQKTKLVVKPNLGERESLT